MAKLQFGTRWGQPHLMVLLAACIPLSASMSCVRFGYEDSFGKSGQPPNDFSGKPPLNDGLRAKDEKGLTIHNDRDVGYSDGKPHRDSGTVPLIVAVDSKNDTCASAATVDLSLLNMGKTVTLNLSFLNATADYISLCGGDPDLVVKFTNAPAAVSRACTGGGQLVLGKDGLDPLTCPPQYVGKNSVTCAPNVYGAVDIPQGSSMIVFCRSATAGDATLELYVP
jgi:hypothetical protein